MSSEDAEMTRRHSMAVDITDPEPEDESWVYFI